MENKSGLREKEEAVDWPGTRGPEGRRGPLLWVAFVPHVSQTWG